MKGGHQMKRWLLLLVAVMVLGLAGPVSADLWDRGGGLIYDDHLNITWLQDANYAKTSGYDADGKMNWTGATTWAANLVYGGYSDWRLPTTVDGPYVKGYDGTTTGGFNITSSEMGYMYYVNLANKGYYGTSGPPGPQPGWTPTPNATFTDGNGNTVSFQNLQSDIYWSGTEYSAFPDSAWWFGTGGGPQEYVAPKDFYNFFAWAVRPGDVTAVPEPSLMVLLGISVMSLAGLKRWWRD
jgi:hypothetical protein